MKMRNFLFCLPLAVFLALGQGSYCAAVPLKQQAQTPKRNSPSQINPKAEAIAYLFRYYNKNLSQATVNAYAKFVLEACGRYSIDPGLIAALIVKESTVKANARSPYAVGLMQIYWKLHKKAIMAQFPHIKTEKILMEPRNNIFVGVWLYSRYLKDCRGNETAALKRYLGGNSQRYLKQINLYRRRYNDRLKANLSKVKK